MLVYTLAFLRVNFGSDFTCATIAGIPLGKPSVCILRCRRIGRGHGDRRDMHRIAKTGTGEKVGYKYSAGQGARSSRSGMETPIMTKRVDALSQAQ